MAATQPIEEGECLVNILTDRGQQCQLTYLQQNNSRYFSVFPLYMANFQFLS